MKRLLDLVVSILLLIIFAPLILVLSLLIIVMDGRPILFRQMRPGYKGRPFRLLKFRTMTQALDSEGVALPDEQRLTPLGNILRKLSLDELPQLLNIIRGEMSLVGPRPLLMQYMELYSEEQARRHEVKPGVTGWAQVNGRNAISWPEKFELDVWYVDNQSLYLYLRIIVLTVVKILKREGISEAGHVTATPFRGNEH